MHSQEDLGFLPEVTATCSLWALWTSAGVVDPPDGGSRDGKQSQATVRLRFSELRCTLVAKTESAPLPTPLLLPPPA